MRRILWALLVLFSLSLGAHAQGLAGFLTEDAPAHSDTNIEEIMAEAARNGVGVVVIDSAGNILSQGQDEAAADPEVIEGSALMKLQDGAVQFRSALFARLRDLPSAFEEVGTILRNASPDGTLWAFGNALVLCLMLFGAGNFVEIMMGRYIFKGYVTAKIKENPQGYLEKMPFLVFRFFFGIMGVIISIIVAYILGSIIFGQLTDPAMQFTVTLINIGYFSCRIAAGLWRMILSPFLAQYRIPNLSDADALKLHRWLWMMAVFDIAAILFGIWIGELGLNYEVYAFLASMLSAAIVLANILLVLVNRRAITRAIRNGKPQREVNLPGRILANIWAPGVILYVLFAWVELTYDLVLGNSSSIPLIAGAYGIIISIIVVYGVTNYIIERGFARARKLRHLNDLRAEQASAALRPDHTSGEAEIAEPESVQDSFEEDMMPQSQGMTTFEDLARRVAAILAFIAGAYAFFYIWDNDSARMVENYADRLLDIMAIMFIGYIVYHAFRIWIDSKIREEQADMPEAELGDEGGASSASRLATLLPLFRNAVLIVLIVTILLIILMELGINVGPLFAGAGIVGVAVGFGSQALVRDIFAGAFFLFDDAFRKGEYLDVGGIKGTVEKISVRSFQLRHHLGYLHTMPFGEIQVMTNFSRDWVMMKLPLRVTYDTDVEKVRKLIKKLGVALLDDPVIGENFIQPLKSQGVIEMQDSAMIIRVKFMTKPGDQWTIRKRVYEEIRQLFEREGIKFAHREVTVRLADGKVEDLGEEEKRAVTAAAQTSIEEDQLEGPQAPSAADDR